MQVSRWGKSLAIRIPAEVAQALDLKEGDDVTITVADERKLEISKDKRRAEMIGKLRSIKLELPEGWVFDRDEANSR